MLWEYYLCTIIDALIDKEYSDFPSLEHLKKGVFNAVFEKTNMKRLRVYNTQNVPLHLRGIGLYCGESQIDENILPPYAASSGAQKNEKELSFRFNAMEKPYMFHTQDGLENNWLEVEFETPVLLTSAVLYGRTNGYVARSGYLALDIVSDQGTVRTVYDYQNILRDTAGELCSKLVTNPTALRFSPEQITLACLVLLSAKNDCMENVAEQLQNLEALGFASSVVKRYINEHILRSRKKQFTMKHGCQYTYNLWTDEEKCVYLDACLEVIKRLTPVSECIFFAYGCLLGFIREPTQFIPHDDDLDIVIVGKRKEFKTKKALGAEVARVLTENGVKVEDVWTNLCQVRYNNSKKIDIFFRIEDDDGKIYISPKLPDVYLTSEECYPTITIDVLGRSCPVPRNPFAFLNKVYGPDWRIPQDRKICKNVTDRESIRVSLDEGALLKEAEQVMTLNEKLYHRVLSEKKAGNFKLLHMPGHGGKS